MKKNNKDNQKEKKSALFSNNAPIEALFQEIIRTAEDDITISDTSGKVLYFNGMDRMRNRGTDPQKLVSMMNIERIEKCEFLDNYKDIWKSIISGNPWRGEIIVRDAHGKRVWLSSMLFLVHDKGGGGPYVAGIHRNITDLKLQIRRTDFRISVEKLISDISRRFIPPFDLDEAVNKSFKEIGELFQVDRVYLFETDVGNRTISNTHEWTAEGISAEIDNLQEIPFKTIPWWMERLENGKTINIKDVSSMPEEASAEKEILQAQNIKSILVVPTPRGSYFHGFMGLDLVRGKRKWNPEDENMLVTATQIISRGIEQERAEKERRLLEKQLMEKTKTEAVGRLSRGIAHDFNNLMAVISAGISLLQTVPEDEKVVQSCLEDISKAASRAGELTRSLLSYSREQNISTGPLDLTNLINEAVSMARRSIPENIDVIVKTARNLPEADADRGRLLQVLIDILFNARDSMPGGGTISINCRPVTIKKLLQSRNFDVPAGRYISIKISDTGMGMTPEVIDKIFDPFFTTKEPHRGTGLGLSNAYGAIRDHEGVILVDSKPDRGSSFTVIIPVEN